MQIYQYLKIPHELKNIPRIPIFRFFADIINRRPFDVTYKNSIQTTIEKKGYALGWRLGGWAVFVQDVDSVKEIHHNTDVFEKSPFAAHELRASIFGKDNILMSNGKEWKRHRKIANPAFHKKWSTDTFGKCTFKAIKKIDSSPNKFDVHDLMSRITIDVLGRAIFDYEFDAINGENNKLYKDYKKFMNEIKNPWYNLLPFMDLIYRSAKRKQAFKASKDFTNSLNDIIDKKRQDIFDKKPLPDKQDLVCDMIMASEGNKITNEEIVNNLKIFFLAGHDTTANSLTSAIYFLSTHPEYQEKARKEVLQITDCQNTVKIPTIEQQSQMHYLDVIIKESMRIATTVAQVARKVSKDYVFKNGLKVSKGNIVVIHSYGLHHDSKLYKDPYTFSPERFEKDNLKNDWMPFGLGTRVCMGMNFSMIEQKTVLAMLLMKYNFKVSEDASCSGETVNLSNSGLLRYHNLFCDFSERI